MNTRKLHRTTPRILLLFVTAMLILATLSMPLAPAAQEGNVIRQLTSVRTNYKDYLDNSIMYRLPDTVNDNDTISVIVKLDAPALLDRYEETDRAMSFTEYYFTDARGEVEAEIAKEKDAYLKLLTKNGIDFETGAEYSAVLSGFEVLMLARDFEKAERLLGDGATAIVGEVYEPAETKLVENEVNYYENTGIFDSSSFAYDGSGMVVAVLDTGLDYTHTAFSAAPDVFTSGKLGLTKAEVAAVLGDTNAAETVKGLLADDVYISAKVPFGFDYADGDTDVYSLHNNHGTHVSGVIVGKDDVITGVAPNAQLVSMKIFSDIQDSARSSWILSALEDCVVLGVDVINMSLGTACGFSRETDKEAMSGVYDRIREQGISLVVAASNSYTSSYGSEKNGNLGLTSNPDTSTVGSPSTYAGALSVASINGAKTPYLLYKEGDTDRIVYFVEATNSATDEKKFVDEILPAGVESATMEYVVIPGAGREADYTGMDVTGKIVLVRRGSNTFEEKANAAETMGAAGIIVYNNVSGEIKMNAGTSEIPICSISQDDGEVLAEKGSGTIVISRKQTSGPFMSDFSSWGPTPDLEIKPEITAHGGNILSAVTGGTYDRLSGTSMACPNTAGVVALLRQHVMDAFPEIKDDPVAIAATVNRLLMSTADIVYNKNGLPYAVRKQGAGLANLNDAAATKAYIITYDREDGSVMDKSKIELGDDKTKSGVYELSFSVWNYGTTAITYSVAAEVMTEGVSDTKTHNGETTVTEEGYRLDGAKIEITSSAKSGDTEITVNAGATADVTVKITLSESDKAYLDASFANGMYVEGFIMLDAVGESEIDLSVPYLAFYGDWTRAPLFDLDYFETNADELDDSIELLDKTLPDAYATRPIGGVSEDYVSYLGSYYFVQDPNNKIIAADRNYVAISNQDGTVHTLRFVWAGMLRNAKKIVVTITDDATGEVVFTTVENDVRKSYGDGGSTLYPANVKIEFDAMEHNLKNNTTYTVTLQGYLDYGDGGLTTNENNTFSFPLTVDFEAPAVTGCEFYTEYDKTEKKNRLFAKIAVYDNHYAMAMQVGYVALGTNDEGNAEFLMTPFDAYLTPIYSKCDDTTYVTYELTDYIYEIKNKANTKNTFTVSCYDYALNEATYEIPLPDDFLDFYLSETEITLNPNETYTLTPLVYPATEWPELLQYVSSNQKVARIVNNKIVAVGSGVSTVTVYDPVTNEEAFLKVTVRAEGDDGYRVYDKPVADVFELTGYDTLKAYYRLANTDREIGETGDHVIFSGALSLTMFPSESVKLSYALDAFFPDDVTVVFESGNDNIVTVDENGVIVAQAEGYSAVTVRLLLDGKSTYYSETVSITVENPYIRTGPSLTHYFGLGGRVEIPESLLLTEIGSYAFSNYNYIPKDENDEISEDSPDATKMWYIGEDTITKVVIPEGVEKIGAYAFANLTALEEVVLPSTLEAIEYGAFLGCTKLKTVKGIENVKLINKEAFFGCNLTGTLSLDNAHAIADFAFAENQNLTEVRLPATLRSIGAYAFLNDAKLATVTVGADSVKYGPYVFAGCRALTEMKINTAVIPTGAFYGCTSLTSLTIGKDVSAIGEYALTATKLTSFSVESGNAYYKAEQNKPYLVSADGKTLVLYAPATKGSVTIFDPAITEIGLGAFAGNANLTSVTAPSVTIVSDYAFADCTNLRTVSFATLESIGKYAFSNTALTAHPSFDGLSMIGDYAFAYTDLKEVTIKDGMTVGEGAFCECQSLAKVTIGDGVTLKMGAFMLGRDAEHTRTEKDNWKATFFEKDGKRHYYYEYLSALTELTIGKNAVIGDSAFLGAAKLVRVSLGDGAVIGDNAFYNADSLAEINLSAAVSIGKLAFSGDVVYYFSDNQMQSPIIENNLYVYRYYAPDIEEIDLSAAVSIGEQSFLYAQKLHTATLGSGITEIPYMAFANCDALVNINLAGVTFVGSNAFAETALTEIDLSAAEKVDIYAFAKCVSLSSITLSENGTDLMEGAFAYCEALTEVENLDKVKNIGAYAFARAGITEADLSCAESIGDHAFMKEFATPFRVTLAEDLVTLGDNPFAMCVLAPFSCTVTESFDGKDYTKAVYTFDISDTVKVIDGSLYCKVPNGLELVAYAGTDAKNVTVAEGTVRVTALAFAGSDVIRVTLPVSLVSLGHKAFYDCDELITVIFKSYNAPNLEEEFDQLYHDSFENIPATGDFTFTGYEGDIITHPGIEIVPFFMWNATGGKYSNVYYGASFVDYIGHIEAPIVMVRPSNGQNYETFIYGQYFSVVVDGAVAPDAVTLAAIEAITLLPNPVQLSDEALVVAARAAYNKIATLEQQALVTNYSLLITAEKRIEALRDDPTDEPTDDPVTETPTDVTKLILIALVIAETVVIVAGATVIFLLMKKKNNGKDTEATVSDLEAAAETEAEATPVAEDTPAKPTADPEESEGDKE